MLLQPECVPCLIKQIQRLLEPVALPPARKLSILVEACGWLRDHYRGSVTTTAFSTQLYRAVYRAIGPLDPLAIAKSVANREAAALLAAHEWSAWSLEQRVRAAIAGNVIDHSLPTVGHDLAAALTAAIGTDPANGSSKGSIHGDLAAFAATVSKAQSVLYVTDNCGEIVLDRPLLAWLSGKGISLCIAGGDGIMSNDASIDDLRLVGLDEFGAVVAKGPAAFGIDPAEFTQTFRALWEQSDLIVAKGQACFESIGPGQHARVWHLFRVKCPLVSDQLDLPIGTNVAAANLELRVSPNWRRDLPKEKPS